jgi:rod shape-determining protein MreC
VSKNQGQSEELSGAIRRLILSIVIVFLAAIFVLWRIDNPRIERLRAQVIDTVMPSFGWATAPVTATINLVRDFRSYQRLYQQNQELRNELQRMKTWKEAATQLHQENARLLDLNKVRLDPQLTYVTGVVAADSGSPFRQSVLLNVGRRDGIVDGWATMDGLGLVGRISGVGEATSRVILLTDTSSRIPALIQPAGQRAIISGDNTIAPPVEFLENPDLVRPGDQVVTSGDDGVLPAGLLIGHLAQSPSGRLRVRLSADFERLEFLRVLRDHRPEIIDTTGEIVGPKAPDLQNSTGANENDNVQSD